MRPALEGMLLGLVLLLEAGSVLGLLLMPHLFDRLHFLGPTTTVASVLLAAAVITRETLDHQGVLALLIAAFLVTFQGVVSHATARAARTREHGDWRLRPDEAARRP
jgi:multisubunit Na+/H+ antiporter MnhG subunit